MSQAYAEAMRADELRRGHEFSSIAVGNSVEIRRGKHRGTWGTVQEVRGFQALLDVGGELVWVPLVSLRG